MEVIFRGFRELELSETRACASQTRATYPQSIYNRLPTSSRGLATLRSKNQEISFSGRSPAHDHIALILLSGAARRTFGTRFDDHTVQTLTFFLLRVSY